MLRSSSSKPWERAVKARGVEVKGRGMVPAERAKSSTGAGRMRPGDLIEKFLIEPCGSVAGAGAEEEMTEELEWQQPRVQSQSGSTSGALCVQPKGSVAATVSGTVMTAEAGGESSVTTAEAISVGVVRSKALPKAAAKKLNAEKAAGVAAKMAEECKQRKLQRRRDFLARMRPEVNLTPD